MSPEEVERYARHLVMREVGGAGQQRLAAARVLVVGAGGLGAPVLTYLAAAGVGTLRIADDDTVALSNLQRQVIFGTEDVGAGKAERAAAAIRRLNPHVAVEPRPVRFAPDTAADLLANATVAADATDNAAARYAIADACEAAKIPLVSAAAIGLSGTLTTLTPHENGPDGAPWPRYRDLYPVAPRDGEADQCATLGVLGVVTGLLGTLQASEVLKLILGIGEPLRGRLLMVDARGPSFDVIDYARAPT